MNDKSPPKAELEIILTELADLMNEYFNLVQQKAVQDYTGLMQARLDREISDAKKSEQDTWSRLL